MYLSCLEELPDQKTKQQPTIVVIILVLDVHHIETALLIGAIELVLYPIPDHIEPIASCLSDILFMLSLERCYRVDNINLVLLSLAIYVYNYEAPVTVFLVVAG
jgi:hypothetical protein